MEVHLSDDEKLFLIEGVEVDVRNDGRSSIDFRQIILERGVLSGTDGSSRCQLGRTTDVLAGIKLELESYDPTIDEEPKPPIQFFVDFSANASSQFAGKGGDNYAEEIAAAFQVAYRNVLDIVPQLTKTKLADGYRWKIYADVTVIQWNGSVIDAISLAIIGALTNMNIPEVELAPDDGGKVSIVLKRPRRGGNVRDEDVPVAVWSTSTAKFPLLLTVSKIGTKNVMDCTPEEETCVRSQLCVGVTLRNQSEDQSSSDVEVTCVKQIGGGLLEIESIHDMIETTVHACRGLYITLMKRFATEDLRKPGHSFLL